MNFEDVWSDLLANQHILSREEVEYEIAMNDEWLAERERLIWGLFDSDREVVYSELETLYMKVVGRIIRRNYE